MTLRQIEAGRKGRSVRQAKKDGGACRSVDIAAPRAGTQPGDAITPVPPSRGGGVGYVPPLRKITPENLSASSAPAVSVSPKIGVGFSAEFSSDLVFPSRKISAKFFLRRNFSGWVCDGRVPFFCGK